jgi:hypothetical protein
MGADAAKEKMSEIETNARNLSNTDSIAPVFKSLHRFSGELFFKLAEAKKDLELPG